MSRAPSVRVLRLRSFGRQLTLGVSGLSDTEWIRVLERWSRALDHEHTDVGRVGTIIHRSSDPIESARLATEGHLVLGPDDLPLERRFDSLVMRAAIAATEGLLLLHAGAVRAPSGATAILLARTFGGKSTAVVTLSRLYDYVADDVVGFDDRFVPLALAAPPLLRRQSDSRLLDPVVSSTVSPSAASASPRRDPSLGPLLLLERSVEGPPIPVVRAVSLIDAVEFLAEAELDLARAPQYRLRRLAALVAASSGVHRVRYREAESLAPVLDHLLDRA